MTSYEQGGTTKVSSQESRYRGIHLHEKENHLKNQEKKERWGGRKKLVGVQKRSLRKNRPTTRGGKGKRETGKRESSGRTRWGCRPRCSKGTQQKQNVQKSRRAESRRCRKKRSGAKGKGKSYRVFLQQTQRGKGRL